MLVILSVVWVTIPFTLFPLAEEHINSAVTGMPRRAVPFFAGLIGALFFHRPPATSASASSWASSVSCS